MGRPKGSKNRPKIQPLVENKQNEVPVQSIPEEYYRHWVIKADEKLLYKYVARPDDPHNFDVIKRFIKM